MARGNLDAGWVRTRLRTSKGGAVALGLLVFFTAFLAAAFPRAVDTYQDGALREAVTDAPPTTRAVTATVDHKPLRAFGDPGAAQRVPLRGAQLEDAAQTIRKQLRAPLEIRDEDVAYGVRTGSGVRAYDRSLPRPDGEDAQFQLDARAGLADHSRLVDGAWPKGGGERGAGGVAFRAAVTRDTAKALKLRVGSKLHFRREGTVRKGPRGTDVALGDAVVTVTGIVEPVEPGSEYWALDPLLLSAREIDMPRSPGSIGLPPRIMAGALLLPEGAGPDLFEEFNPGFLPYTPVSEPQVYWKFPVAAGALHGDDAAAIRAVLNQLAVGPALIRLQAGISPDLAVGSGLLDVLAGYEQLRDAIAPVVSVAAFGVGTTAAVVLLMTGGLAVVRRGPELRLMRSRGGSLAGLSAMLALEAAAAVVPATLAALLLAVLVLPDGRLLPAVAGAGVVAVLAVVALPVRAAAQLRRVRPAGRQDLVAARPSRRRTVLELTGLALAVGAIVALRRRGAAPGDVDALLSAAPVLAAVVAASLFVRLYPLPLRLAARPAARGRGAIGFLSLARAGRTHAAAALPLLALLVALTTASFGGSVTAGVEQARTEAALYATGADARIESGSGGALPAGLAGRVAKVPGVSGTVGVTLEPGLGLDESGSLVTLVIAEPRAYADLTAELGFAAFSAEALTGDTQSSMPALISPGVEEALVEGTLTLQPTMGQLRVRAAAVLESTPAWPGGNFVVVSSEQVAKDYPDFAADPLNRPDTLLLDGSGPQGSGIDAGALKRTVTASGGETAVKLRAEAKDAFDDSLLQRGAERLYVSATFAGAAFAVLAVLLSLLQAAPERKALLARLRTMGLTPAHGRRLLVLEALPQVLLAGGVGVLLGIAAVRLVEPGIDLAVLAGALTGSDPDVQGMLDARLVPDPAALLLPSLAVPALVVAAVLTQSWWTGRQRAATELRAGDRE
ncbi:hypothetical protein SRB5_52510 [Streptomyces sp. RB5]|uniref:ABC3 transporter permease C-terminal domain-containing protein n=1 Tax=Streptomyces smaragdinus TaxID=2585196 RepID=A0A7K0CP51_9ACTN|nr:FtsX-like permease family protein [Streptomyces smaragdinus]MQY15073.1 hypothetical protein [Streptomyces smaragdinus]